MILNGLRIGWVGPYEETLPRFRYIENSCGHVAVLKGKVDCMKLQDKGMQLHFDDACARFDNWSMRRVTWNRAAYTAWIWGDSHATMDTLVPMVEWQVSIGFNTPLSQ